MTDLLNAAQVAERLGLTPGRVRQLCQAGTLPAFQVGKIWLIKEADLAAFIPTPRGWPKGVPRKAVAATGKKTR